MTNRLVINGKYPLGFSPFLFGTLTLSWKFIIFVSWLISGINGHDYFAVCLLLAFIPELCLWIYEKSRNKKFGWIIKPVLNTMKSAKMIKESRPTYRTIFGYNRIDSAPTFYIEKISGNRGYLLIFEPNGCPNADQDFLPILQAELPQYDVVPQGNVRKQFLIYKRGRKGRRLTNEDFY